MAQSLLNNLPLEWVRAFEAAGRNGSFTAAARETGLTQAAISQRIGNLENKIGTRLFIRKARGITLTVDGEAWLPYVTDALTTVHLSAQELFGIQRQHLTVSASASIIELWIVPRLRCLPADENTQYSFKTMVLSSDAAEQGEVIKIRYGSGNWIDHFQTPLFKEQISPVMSPKLEGSDCNWKKLPRIVLSGPRPGWKEWIHYTGDPATPVPTLQFDSFSSALAAARAGLGVLLASLPLCIEDFYNHRLVRVSELVLPAQSTYWLLASKSAVSLSQWEILTNQLVEQA